MDFTIDELMTAALAREVPDWSTIYVGAGVPLCLAAAVLAKATHAPHAQLFPVAGLEARRPFTITLRAVEAAAWAAPLIHEMAEILNRVEGSGVLEPLAPAQIDGYGNMNTIVIGPYEHPTVRLPGFAGADAVGSMPACNVLYTTRHTRRVLVEQVDFVMAAGRGARRKLGAAPGGPRRLITNLAVFDAEEDGRWRTTSIHPGVSWEDVRANTGFALPSDPPRTVTPPPSPAELDLLRRRIDPFGVRRLEFSTARERRDVLAGVMAAERAWLANPGRLC